MRYTLVLASLIAVAIPSTAFAQGSTGELSNHHHRFRIAGDVGFFYQDTSASSRWLLNDGLNLQFELASWKNRYNYRDQGTMLQLDFEWRASVMHTEQPSTSDTNIGVGNPYIGLRGGYRSNDVWARGGIGFTLPVTNLDDDLFGVAGNRLLLDMSVNGVWSPWLSAPARASVVARGDFEYRPSFGTFGAEVAASGMLPVEYEGVEGDTIIALQAATWAAGRFGILALGARFQAVAWLSTDPSSEEGFLSLIPFVRIETDYFFIETRLVMNLDEPLGFAFDDGGLWSLKLLAGGTF